MISGWKDNGSKVRKKREYDFLILSEKLKTIIHIEAKLSNSDKGRNKAAEQLKNGLDFFKEILPFPENEHWKYARVMYFGKGKDGTSEQSSSCSECGLFLLNPDTKLDEWWKEICQKIDASTLNATFSYIQICKFLLHQMFKQNQPVTQSDTLKYTEYNIETRSRVNNIFWTNTQFLIFNGFNKHIFFPSAYGTGKTILIKAKAKELVVENLKVIIVLFKETDTSQDSLLQLTYENEVFGPENRKAKIFSLDNSG